MSSIAVNFELLMKSQAFQAALKLARGEFDEFDNKVKRVGDTLNKTGGFAQSFLSGISARLTGDAILSGLETLKNSVSDIVSTVSVTQQLDSQLKALTTSSEEFAATQAYLQETAVELSTDVMTLSKSYVQLLVLRDAKLINTDESKQLLEGMSNYAARMGVTKDQVGMAMYGLSQALGSGTVRAEELNQVTEAPPWFIGCIRRSGWHNGGRFPHHD